MAATTHCLELVLEGLLVVVGGEKQPKILVLLFIDLQHFGNFGNSLLKPVSKQ